MKFKKILNNIGMLIIILAIIVFNLIIGGNEKPLPILTLCAFIGPAFIILLVKKIKYKEKLIKSKIDILVTIFMAILFMPLLFRTYCSFEGSIEFILKYFFVYTIYLLTRNVVDTKKKFNILIAVTVWASLIFLVLGIDLQHEKIFDWLLIKLDLKYSDDYRFSSTFGYANAVSIYVLFCIFLSINRIENLQKIIPKIFYFAYIILGTYVIYISYSRVVLILYTLSIGIYLICKIYNKIKNNKKLLSNIIFIGIITFGLILIYLIIAIRIPRPYIAGESLKLRKKLEPNTEYVFEFDTNITTNERDTTSPQLVIVELNKYFNETEIGRIILAPEEETHKIRINTTEDLYYIKFYIINAIDKEVVINHFYIDNEEYIFKHKYIPSVISRLIISFSLRDDSIVLRKQFYENCLRISKDSLIIGHGGNAWKRLSLAYADYPYSIKETHSYFFELLISYGIVGVIAFLGMIVWLCKTIIKELIKNKEKRKQKLSVFIGLMLLIIYNLTFDFGMSFIVLILATFQFIALLQFENEEDVNLKFIDIAVLITIGVVFITLTCSTVAKYAVNNPKTKAKLAPYVVSYNVNAMDEDNLEDIISFIKKEPYRRQNDMYKLYWNVLYENKNVFTKEQLEKYINFGIKTFETKKCVSPIYFSTIFERVQIMADSVKKLEEIENTNDNINKLKEQMQKEYNIYSKYLQDTNRNYKTQAEAQNAMKDYKSILETIDIKTD